MTEIPDYKTIKEILYRSEKLYRDRVAFTTKKKNNEEIQYTDKTYKMLLEDINAFGAFLYDCQLKGERVAVFGRNRYEWAVAHFANLMGNIISVPLDKELQLGELEDSLIRSGAKAIVFDEKYVPLLQEIRERNKTKVTHFICMSTAETFLSMPQKIEEMKKKPKKIKLFTDCEVDAQKMSILLFTSGTTSKSKAVMLSQEGIVTDMLDMMRVQGIRPDDVNIAILPYHHIFGATVGLFMAVASGVKTVFADGLRYIKDNLKEYQVTVFVGVPVLVDKMYQNIQKEIQKQGKTETVERAKKISRFLRKFHIDIRRKLFHEVLDGLGGKLRLIFCGGAPLDKELAIGFTDFGVELVQGYGLTETSPVIAAEDPKHRNPGSVGIPLRHVQVKIENADENGVGEIHVKGCNVMLGYYEKEEETKEVLKDGWFDTGDLGYLDKNGFLFITGRKKDVIVLKNGKKVFPDELELLLLKIPAIEEAFVYGKPDEEDKNDVMVCAKLVYNEKTAKEEYGELSEKELYQTVWNQVKEINQTLPKYKYMKGLILTKEPLIKTTTNKVKRNEELRMVLQAANEVK